MSSERKPIDHQSNIRTNGALAQVSADEKNARVLQRHRDVVVARAWQWAKDTNNPRPMCT